MGREHPSERRKDERYPLGFSVKIFRLNHEGEEYLETAVMRDISGGGARFLSTQPQHYEIGTRLMLYICLPGDEEIAACMKGPATVVWVGYDGSGKSASGEVQVGVSLDQLLTFEQLRKPCCKKQKQGESGG